MRRLTGVVAILLSFTLAACGSSSPDGAAPSSASAQTQAVASIGLGDVDTLLALGITPTLVAPWSQDAVEPVGEWAKPLLKGAEPKTLLGASSKLDDKAFETIAAAKPTLIVAVNSGFDDAAFARLEQIAPVIRRPTGYTAWSVPWQEQVRTIANGVKRSQQGEELITTTNEAITQAKKDNPTFAGKTAATVTQKSGGGYYLYSTGDGRGQILSMLGFVLPESLEKLVPAGTFYANISAENVSVLDLDTLVYLDYGNYHNDETAFNALAVSRDHRVTRIGKDLGTPMSMPNPVTIQWVLKKLPEKMPKLA